MAEQALYEIFDEPCFPSNSSESGRLAWLPRYLSDHIVNPSYSDLDPLLNTVLVFARAQTATIQDKHTWNIVQTLVKRLNTAADSVLSALHHRVELVPQGPSSFLVICSRSPCFNWKVSPTHCEVGRNLDFFAPGHNTMNPSSKKCYVHFV
jgi:hypothetical protein